MRIMVISWGCTLLGLTIMISLTSAWKVTREAAKVTGRLFMLSWVALLSAVLWIGLSTGEWHYSVALNEAHLSMLNGLAQFGINLLIVLAVMIPAAQWPFQRWLDRKSVV